jgi:hypothetical protein
MQVYREEYEELELEYNTAARRLAIMMAEEEAIDAAPEEMLSEVANIMPRNLKVSCWCCLWVCVCLTFRLMRCLTLYVRVS